MKLRLIFSTLLALLILSSCVSKKKYLSMQGDYMSQTDSLVSVTDDLNNRLDLGENDFESTKHDLLVSDASKNDKIASLENQLKELQSGFDEVTRSLDDTKDMVEVSQSESQKTSFQIARMNSDLVKLRQDTLSLNYALTLQKRKAKDIQSTLDDQLVKYAKEISGNTVEVSRLKKDMETSRLKTKEVERQLAIKQKQINDINASFIALRKDLLRAKTQGVVVDPNANNNVSKMAKSLGQ